MKPGPSNRDIFYAVKNGIFIIDILAIWKVARLIAKFNLQASRDIYPTPRHLMISPKRGKLSGRR